MSGKVGAVVWHSAEEGKSSSPAPGDGREELAEVSSPNLRLGSIQALVGRGESSVDDTV